MKTQARTVEIERAGVAETQAFQIKASAQAFRILSDGLYSDKILAIVRELSSNAYDAHVAANTQSRPFTVHLPNSLEPWFNMRDYGTGLSHEDVMHLYSTYFDSSKTDTNDATGMLGLGSKSPFSYTESFTVTSFFNGEQRTYLVDIGEEGVPQISLVAGFPIDTDQHNGLEIQFAVTSTDFRDFEEKAKQVYKRYNPLPEVVGVPNFELEPVEYLFEGEGWRLFKSNKSDHYAQCLVIQGTVAYPVDLNAMRNIDRESYDMLFGLNLEMDFAIGELDVAANRETLSYDERTIANLVARADKAKKEIGQQLSEKFEACETMWAARLMWTEVFGAEYDYQHPLKKLVKSLNLEIKWRDQEITQDVQVQMDDDLSMHGFNIKSSRRSRYGKRVRGRRYTKDSSYNSVTLLASTNVHLFVDDLGGAKGAASRVHRYVEDLDDSKVEVYLIQYESYSAYQAVVDSLGGAPIRNVSELDKPTRKSVSKAADGSRGNGYIFKMPAAKYNHSPGDFWTATIVDFKAGGYYLPVNRGKAHHGNGVFEGKMFEIMTIAKDLGIFDHEATPVYGIPKSAVVKLRGGWHNLFAYITAEIAKMVAANNMDESIAKTNAYQKFHNSVQRASRVEETISKLAAAVTNKSGLISKLSSLFEDHKTINNHNSLRQIARELAFTINLQEVEVVDLVDLFKQILADYPMLYWPLDQYNVPSIEDLQNLVNYVNMVDNAAEIVLDSE